MEKEQEMVLDEFAPDLKSSLNLPCLLPHLMQRKLLTASEERRLKSGQAKTDRDINSEFIDYLKTKGSRAFPLFLESLKDEDEHLGHADLWERMSQRAESARTLEASSHDQSALWILRTHQCRELTGQFTIPIVNHR